MSSVVVKSVSVEPIEGKKAAASFFRTRLWVTSDVDPAPGKSRQSMVNALRKILRANTEALGLEADTRFYFSKFAGACNVAWGDGGGFILDRAAKDAEGRPLATMFVHLGAAE